MVCAEPMEDNCVLFHVNWACLGSVEKWIKKSEQVNVYRIITKRNAKYNSFNVKEHHQKHQMQAKYTN